MSTDRTASWIRGQISERAHAGDVLAIASACASLAGHGSMIFGMVVTDFAGRDAVSDEALAALRLLVRDMPDDRCDAVFATIARANLPVNVEDRGARLEASRRAGIAAAVERLRERLGTADPRGIADAAAAIQTHNHRVLGIDMPPQARAGMLAFALQRLRLLVDTLTDDVCEELFAVLRRANVPADMFDDRRAAILARRRDEGSRALAVAKTEPFHHALEQAIGDNPDDAQAYAVLADWLQAKGHPRGELMSLQLRAETDPVLQPVADAYLATHAAALYGPLARHLRTCDGLDHPAFEWRRGYVHRARLSHDEHVETSHERLANLLAMLLEHPSGRHLASLHVGINGSHGHDTLDDVVDTLAGHAPTPIRELIAGDFSTEQCEVSWYQVGDLGPAWRALPALRDLVVHGGSFGLGAIDLPVVERAAFRTGGLSQDSLAAIASARWPKLRRLDVWFGDPDYGCDCRPGDVRPLLARGDLALTRLGLMNCGFADDLPPLLARAPLLASVTELDLSMGTLSDAGAQALADAKLRVAVLDVSSNYLGDAGIEALRRAYPTVHAGDQRDGDAEDRMVSVGE